tara:strand:- start:1327 stop:1446 length:120 start_codon:yes stop_codon:yes gene_type:complete
MSCGIAELPIIASDKDRALIFMVLFFLEFSKLGKLYAAF